MILCEAGLVDELQHGVETLCHKSLDQMTVTSFPTSGPTIASRGCPFSIAFSRAVQGS